MSVQLRTNDLAFPRPQGDAAEVLKLVEKWLAEDNGYDAKAWPVIAHDIEENRLSSRNRFQDRDHDTLLH